MRLAVFHDFFDKIDGGEKVALTLARRFDADLFTTNLRAEVVERIGAGNLRIHDLGPLVSTPLLKQTHASWRFHNARVPDYDAYL
ncbi:MAG: glycosyltransferase family 4 protein, partial [Thermoplasmata archaeon]